MAARLALRYCGCCNPQVNLSRIAAQLARAAERAGFRLVAAGEEADFEVVLCGCPRGCGRLAPARARRSLIVAGASLDGKSTAEGDLAAAIEEELKKLIGGS